MHRTVDRYAGKCKRAHVIDVEEIVITSLTFQNNEQCVSGIRTSIIFQFTHYCDLTKYMVTVSSFRFLIKKNLNRLNSDFFGCDYGSFEIFLHTINLN